VSWTETANPDLHHLAAPYAVDALDDRERRDFEAHYLSCDICSQEVIDFSEVAGALATGVSLAPPPELKASLMAGIGSTRQLSPRLSTLSSASDRRRNWVLAAAAAALLVVGGAVGAVAIDRTDPVTELVAEPDSRVTTLTGSQGSIQIVHSAERDQVAVFGADLPDPGEENAYALWFLLDDGVAPAGLFKPDDGTVREVLNIDGIETTGWGITIEPATGSDQPTTPVIFAGTF